MRTFTYLASCWLVGCVSCSHLGDTYLEPDNGVCNFRANVDEYVHLLSQRTYSVLEFILK